MAIGISTLKDLRNDLRSRLREHGNTSKYLDSELNKWINQGVKRVYQILTKTDPSYYTDVDEVVLAGSREYSLTVPGEIISIFYDGKMVPLLTPEMYAMRESLPLYSYTVYGHYAGKDKVKFNMDLNGAIRAVFIRPLVEMVNDDDKVDIPEKYIELVMLYAMSVIPQESAGVNLIPMIESELKSLFSEKQLENALDG